MAILTPKHNRNRSMIGGMTKAQLKNYIALWHVNTIVPRFRIMEDITLSVDGYLDGVFGAAIAEGVTVTIPSGVTIIVLPQDG